MYLLPFWNRAGVVKFLEPYPDSFHDWELGQEVIESHRDLHTAIPKILNRKMLRTSCKALDMNIVSYFFV